MQIEIDILDNNFDKAKTKLDSLLSESKDNPLNTVIVYKKYIKYYSNQNDFEKALNLANLSKQVSDKTADKLDDAYTNYSYAQIYLINQLYDKTIAYSNKALDDLKTYPNQYLLYSEIYSLLGITHSRSGIYSDEYKNYVLTSLNYALKSKDVTQIITAQTAVSMMYMHKYNRSKDENDLKLLLKSTIDNLDFVENIDEKNISIKAKIITYNNFASLINSFQFKGLSKNERTNKAKNYIQKGLNLALKIKNNLIIGICYATYGEIIESEGNNQLAESYYLKAYHTIKSDKSVKPNTINDIVNLLSNFYENNNQPEKALFFNKEALEVTNQAYQITLDNKRKFLEAYYNSEKKNQEIKLLKEKNDLYSKQIYLYLGIVILSISGLIFLMYLIRYRQKINKQQTDLLVSEKNETSLTLQLEQEEKARLKAETDLAKLQQEQLHKQALATTIQLDQKNSVINELKEKVKDGKIVTLDRILKEDKISDHDFNNLNTIIKDVHPNFFNKLNEISKSKLTNQDFRYAAYIYLNMDNAKIAEILRVEIKTVRMTKYRLKQKIGIDKDVDLTEFIHNLEL